MSRLLVAVIGGASCTPAEVGAAETVGRVLAEGGAALLCGGRGGVMEAACRGARSAGGLTVGILPGDDPSAANPYVEIVIPTGLGEARNAIVARAAGAVVAIGGRYGTLSEIAFALKGGVPVVGVNTWQLTPPDERFSVSILRIDDPVLAARRALTLARGASPSGAGYASDEPRA